MQDKPGPLDLDFRAMELRILAALGPKPRIKLNTLLRTQRTAWADRWMCTGMNADGTNCIGVGVTPREAFFSWVRLASHRYSDRTNNGFDLVGSPTGRAPTGDPRPWKWPDRGLSPIQRWLANK